MHVALRRRLPPRCPLLTGDTGVMVFRVVALRWTRSATTPRPAHAAASSRAAAPCWSRLGGLGPEGRVVPQQWLANTSAPRLAQGDRRRLDFVLYGAMRMGKALCCNSALVAPLRRDVRPQARTADEDGAAIATERRPGIPSCGVLALSGWLSSPADRRRVETAVAGARLGKPDLLPMSLLWPDLPGLAFSLFVAERPHSACRRLGVSAAARVSPLRTQKGARKKRGPSRGIPTRMSWRP